MVDSSPSLKQIAAIADVSIMTVSLALRDHSRIPLATRQRIQSIARDLGYRPNPMLHALMAHVRSKRPVKSTTKLAFITAFPTRDGWKKTSHVYRESYEGAQARARQLGYEMEEFWVKEPGMTGKRLTEILETRNIRGLLIAAIPQSHGHLSLDWSKFAAATFGPSLYRPDLPRATADHFVLFMMALRRMIKISYRRIGLVLSHASDERVTHAYTAALYHYHHMIATVNRIPPLLNDNLTEAQYRKWFDRYRPDVVVGSPGLMNWVMKWGWRVPQDVGYVDLQWPRGMKWAGIDQHNDLIGAAGVDLVVGQLQRNEFGAPQHPKIVTIRAEWVDGNTVRKTGKP